MRTASICLIFLACASVCFSMPTVCCHQCLAMNKNVRFTQIRDVEVLAPSPPCNHKKVIVTLKDGTRRCLNPNAKFTQALLKTKKIR
ncbi:permeability factor 2-like isoform X2 [Notolabrus celidotus]|uniref:permeability factor 2-like isoform X2 n=1 Tax=Notolabrus celidotus TaxID=1203425 RepID=UPI00148F5883|nr:permeability factor 2-like isoform X2 [Notolabrus celidotus]